MRVNMTNYFPYSVLMSVYCKENAVFLETAMNSIWNQSVKPDDFVLVCDGPLSDSLNAVIEQMQREHPDTLQVVRLKTNGGLGNALNIGIKYCKNEWIARMDSDDISRPERCETQLKLLTEKREISICSGIVQEFSESIDKIDACRVPPEHHPEILAFARKRNPFNHPCVMYKKSAVEAAGGYQDFYLLEDYYLWIRMLQNGCQGYNLQVPLLWMRAGSQMYQRRSGWKYARSQVALFRYMRNTGFIGTGDYITSVVSRGVAALMPNAVRRWVYKLVLRKGFMLEKSK